MSKMRIKITGLGIFGAAGEVPIGEEFVVAGPLPAAWAGRYEVLSSAGADASPITNPAITREEIDGMKKGDVLTELESRKWDGDKSQGVEKLRAELADLVFPAK